jgi:hypothetical protein
VKHRIIPISKQEKEAKLIPLTHNRSLGAWYRPFNKKWRVKIVLWVQPSPFDRQNNI